MNIAKKADSDLEFVEDFREAATAAKSLQSCPTLCDPIDSSPPGSTIPGILQARTLEQVAIILVSDGMDAEDSCIMNYYFSGVLRILFFFFSISCVLPCDSEGCSRISTAFIAVLAGTLCNIKQFYFKIIFIYSRLNLLKELYCFQSLDGH